MTFNFTVTNVLKPGGQIWLQHTSDIDLFRGVISNRWVTLHKVDDETRTSIAFGRVWHKDWRITPCVLRIRNSEASIEIGTRLEVEIPHHWMRASKDLVEGFDFFVYTSADMQPVKKNL